MTKTVREARQDVLDIRDPSLLPSCRDSDARFGQLGTRARDGPIRLSYYDRLLHHIGQVRQGGFEGAQRGSGVVEGVEGYADDVDLILGQCALDEDVAEPPLKVRPVPSVGEVDEDLGRTHGFRAVDG